MSLSGSSLSFFCSVCKASHGFPTEFTRHLTGESHLEQARLQSARWDVTVKQSVLVVFSSNAIVKEDFLQFFSTDWTLVTDFVWWKEKPNFALLQFGSKDDVDEFLRKKGTEMKISIGDSTRLQLKRASDYLDLEWRELLRISITRSGSDTIEDKQKVIRSNSVQKSITAPTRNSVCSAEKLIPTNLTTKPPPPPVQQQMKDLPSTSQKRDLSPTSKQEVNLKRFKSSIGTEFLLICNEMLLTVAECEAIQEIMKLLKGMQSPTPRSAHQQGRKESTLPLFRNNVFVFRNSSLGIRSSIMNEFYFYIDYRGTFDERPDTSRRSIPARESMSNFLQCSKELCNDIRRIRPSAADPEAELHTNLYVHQPSGVQFKLISSLYLIPEIQTSRLLGYLFKFDLRVYPLVILINYWVKLNNIELTESPVTKRVRRDGIELDQDPSSLEWLIVLFLTNKRIIPSVREVSKRIHQEFIEQNVDIGFSNDPDYLRRWPSSLTLSVLEAVKLYTTSMRSDDFLLSILELLREFFVFYSNIQHVVCVLNTQDGEIIKAIDLGNDGRRAASNSNFLKNITESELMLLKTQFASQPWVLIHPLSVKWNLAFNSNHFANNICPLMKLTADKLEKSLMTSSGQSEMKLTLADCLNAKVRPNNCDSSSNSRPTNDLPASGSSYYLRNQNHRRVNEAVQLQPLRYFSKK